MGYFDRIPSCVVCRREIDEADRLSREQQIQMLESGGDVYGTCLGCGQRVRRPGKRYRSNVDAAVLELRNYMAAEKLRLAEAEADKFWPAGTPSLAGRVWLGSCPSCRCPDMYCNLQDYYECFKCRLQICMSDEVQIMPEKGLGQYKLFDRRYLSADRQLDGAIFRIQADHRCVTAVER